MILSPPQLLLDVSSAANVQASVIFSPSAQLVQHAHAPDAVADALVEELMQPVIAPKLARREK